CMGRQAHRHGRWASPSLGPASGRSTTTQDGACQSVVPLGPILAPARGSRPLEPVTRDGNSTVAVDIGRGMAEMETDQALWARARAGDAEAFGTLFERHARAVYRLCFWRTGDVTLAEDLSAAVFLETWRHKSKVAVVDGSIRPWLFGVASNLVRNHPRPARRRDAALRRLPRLPIEPDVADEVVGRVDAETTMRAVLAAVR